MYIVQIWLWRIRITILWSELWQRNFCAKMFNASCILIMIDMRKLISKSSIYWTKVCRNHGINYRISDSKQWCRLSFETSFNFLTERILGSIVCNFSWFMWMLQVFDLENINAIHKFMKHVLAIVVQCKAENVRCLNNLNVIQYYSTVIRRKNLMFKVNIPILA